MATKLTPFGKLVRKHRLENEITLNEMSKKVGVSSAFASAVETGAKRIPDGYVAKVSSALDLDKEQAAELADAAALSFDSVTISLGRGASRADREFVATFARRFNDLRAETKLTMRDLLEEKKH